MVVVVNEILIIHLETRHGMSAANIWTATVLMLCACSRLSMGLHQMLYRLLGCSGFHGP